MDETQDRLSDLLTEFEKIDYSSDYKIEDGSAKGDAIKSQQGFFSLKNLKIMGIYSAVFLIWSFILVGIFLPKYVYSDGTFYWTRFFWLSVLVFLSLVLVYHGTKWMVKKFIQ